VRPPGAAIPSAVGLQRSGDWPAADSDRVAKFQGDRLRGLGESVAKKTSRAEYKPARNGVPGGLNSEHHLHVIR